MLVDVGAPDMFTESLPDYPVYPDDLISPADWLWKVAEGLVRQKIRSQTVLHTGKRDAFGIWLYHTRFRAPVKSSSDSPKKKSKDEQDEMEEEEEEEEEPAYFSTVHEFVPLQPPGIDMVQQLRAVQDDFAHGRRRDLQAEYGMVDSDTAQAEEEEASTSNPLHVALYEALQAFRTSKSVKQKTSKPGEVDDIKQIYIFSTDDNPCRDNPDLVRVLQTAVEDANENGIELFICPLPTSTKAISTFDYSLLYDQIQVDTPLRDLESDSADEYSRLYEQTLQDLLQDSWKSVRRAFPVPLLLPDWRESNRPGIALDVYRLCQLSRLPTPVKIHQQTGRYVCE